MGLYTKSDLPTVNTCTSRPSEVGLFIRRNDANKSVKLDENAGEGCSTKKKPPGLCISDAGHQEDRVSWAKSSPSDSGLGNTITSTATGGSDLSRSTSLSSSLLGSPDPPTETSGGNGTKRKSQKESPDTECGSPTSKCTDTKSLNLPEQMAQSRTHNDSTRTDDLGTLGDLKQHQVRTKFLQNEVFSYIEIATQK